MADSKERSLGLLGATGIGVGAIVGGGILILVGVAYQATGPSAILAFALNGVIAVLTALSFAELSASFPESGGAYIFAKKVLNVRAAFGVGWVLWFAYIVAAALYAIGFAEFAAAIVDEAWQLSTGEPVPPWVHSRRVVIALGLVAGGLYAASLIRRATGGGQLATIGKLVLFAVLIAAGVVALVDRPQAVIREDLTPFFAHGSSGLLHAMGFTFIALQGFDLIAAVAGEVKRPERFIPRSMLLSLGCALVVYLPLLFIVATAGTAPGESIVTMSERNPATVMADAAERFMGPAGFWLVLVAAVLSTLSALQANLLAASRVAFTMAQDRTLPRVLARIDEQRRTPVMAVYATFLTLAVIVVMIPDLAAAGAAASLIFLVSFALAHGMAYLARVRAEMPPPFAAPGFPLIPVVGGLACAGMAVFQGLTVPSAGGITALWLALGGMLYFALFAGRAEAVDAYAQALDPSLAQLRGKLPLVLVPIANPASAPGLVAVANALAPDGAGKVLLLSVMRRLPDVAPASQADPKALESLDRAQQVLHKAMAASLAHGQAPEAILTVAEDPWAEIARVARTYRCENLVLGLSDLETVQGGQLEQLLNEVDGDVVVVRAPVDFRLRDAGQLLVPIGGRGRQDEVRARLLGSFLREQSRDVVFCGVVPSEAPEANQQATSRMLEALGEDEARAHSSAEVIASDDVVDALVQRSKRADLLILGLQRHRGRKLFGEVALQIARGTSTATIMISRRG